MSLPKSDYVSDIWKDGLFANKVIFCTGGAGSICSAQVRAMVHLGANACIVGRQVERTEKVAKDIATVRKGAKVIGIGAVDVRKIETLQAAVDRCVKELGSIDFVIAGAAGNFLATMNQLSPNAFKTVIDIDVIGSYNTFKTTAPHLIKSASANKSDGKTPSPTGTGGRIIFVSATIHYTGLPLQTHVSVAKAGVDSLSDNICLEYGPRGLTSNVIAPGPIGNTEGMDRLGKSDNSMAAIKAIPQQRYGTVKEIADATVFLFSDAANYVNGHTVVVDGGAWRSKPNHPASGGYQYPDFLLSDEVITGVKGTKKSKL